MNAKTPDAPIVGGIISYRKLTRLASGQLALLPPPGQIIWYSRTVKPGQPGNSIIAGHVSYGPPDVFWNLSDIRLGTIISVGCRSGQVLKLQVVQKYPVDKQRALEGQIWQTSKQAWVNFVACDKRSPVVGTHYTRNYVVRTRLNK